jgi:hypothetical protein
LFLFLNREPSSDSRELRTGPASGYSGEAPQNKGAKFSGPAAGASRELEMPDFTAIYRGFRLVSVDSTAAHATCFVSQKRTELK